VRKLEKKGGGKDLFRYNDLCGTCFRNRGGGICDYLFKKSPQGKWQEGPKEANMKSPGSKELRLIPKEVDIRRGRSVAPGRKDEEIQSSGNGAEAEFGNNMGWLRVLRRKEKRTLVLMVDGIN